MSGRVLVCDDEPQILRALRVVLREAGFEVVPTETGAEALDRAAVQPPDAAILDLVLPDTDGIELCHQLREWTQAPIIVLSAVGDEREKVRALDVGADDYITKPFGTEELLARLRAVIRRSAETPGEPAVGVGDLEIDLADRRVRRAGEEIHLTPIEFDLMAALARHRGKLVTHRQLLQEVWGPGHTDATHYLRVHVAHIRAKLETDPARPRYVLTDPGVGYRLGEPPS